MKKDQFERLGLVLSGIIVLIFIPYFIGVWAAPGAHDFVDAGFQWVIGLGIMMIASLVTIILIGIIHYIIYGKGKNNDEQRDDN